MLTYLKHISTQNNNSNGETETFWPLSYITNRKTIQEIRHYSIFKQVCNSCVYLYTICRYIHI